MSPEAFARIAEALRESIAERRIAGSLDDEASWDIPARNRLLDACGSDHRPLVDLVLSVGAAVRPRLRAMTQHGASVSLTGWERDRAPLVHAVVSSRFLQPDVARWAVDAWAVALGVAPRDVLVSPLLAAAERADAASRPQGTQTRHAPAATTHVAATRGATFGVVRPGTTRAGAAARMAMPQSSANARQRIGAKWPTGQRPPTPFDPLLAQRVRRIEKSAVIVLALLVSGVMALLTKALSTSRTTPTVPVMESAVRAAPGAAPASAPAIAPVPAQSPLVARIATTAASASTMSDAALDSLHDAWRATDGFRSAEAARSAVARGVAGDYRVAQRVRSVDGSPSCMQVAQALARPLSTLEHIDHEPGASRMSLSSRGATGTIDATGYFTLGPREGTTNGVRWRFVMQGRFHPRGFTGESRTETFAVIRWGRTQSCIAVADLVGQRAG